MNRNGARLYLLACCWILMLLPLDGQAIETLNIKFIRAITGGAATPLSLPSDVAVHGRQIYVVDGGNHRVVVFDSSGNYLFEMGGKGREPGQMFGPLGIDVGRDGTIYVADRGNHRIQIFDQSGGYLNSFEVRSGKTLTNPIDVAAAPKDGEIYVTGNDNHKVMVFSKQGKLIREWGGNGLERGEFRYPGTLAFMPDARVAVVDILNTRIQLFDPSGRFSLAVGEWGVLPGHLFRPKGVAVNSKGDIYVSDSYMNLIQVFTDTGRFKYVLKIKDGGRALETPTGMAIGADNRLYVAEMLQNRVSIFGLGP